MEIQVLGLKELNTALERFPDEIARKVLSQALRKAAQPMRDEVAQRAPMRDATEGEYLKKRRGGKVTAPGNLKAFITLRVVNIGGIPTALIGWARSAFYGQFLEFGSAHEAPRPFVRPAFDSTYMEVLREFSFQLRLGIERAAKKLYAKPN